MKDKKIYRILFLVLFVGVFALAGCSRSDKGDGSNAQRVTIKGSDTMVHLVSAWAEAIMIADPAMEISVTGGGSGTGIAAMLNGTTDIAASSRNVREKELTLAESKGVDMNGIIVGMDGIAVIVNADNAISTLTMEQLRNLFTGELTNWKEIGGADREIVVLSRESNSGTFVFFQKFVLQKNDYTVSALLLPSSSSIVQTVNDNDASIGYVGLGYAEHAGENVKVLSVRPDENSDAVMPSAATVKSGEYAIARPLFFFVNGEPAGATKTFIEFCLSSEGQKIITEVGYVPVTE